MSTSVQVYNISDVNSKLDKTLPRATTLNCEIYDTTDILNPVLFIDNSAGGAENINYCYISDFGRYYYVTVVVDKHRAYLNCHVDPLMSWKEDIKKINAHIIRQEGTNFSLIPDNMVTALPKMDSIVLKCDGKFTHPQKYDGVQFVVITR